MNRREALALITTSAVVTMSRAYAADQKSGPSGAPSASVFLPRQFGAIGDGRALDSPAIKAAIDACNKGGGGVVYCPPGRYLCGTVELKSNVTLYLGTC